MVRSMPGHGAAMVRYPLPDLMGLPASSTTWMMMPGSGLVAEPGLVGVAPGMGEIMMPPVSVCHQVSRMGQRSLPMTVLYHFHAAGLMGSPTEPSRRREERSRPLGHSSPWRMNARIAVGDV